MREITFTDPHRAKHLAFFRQMAWPHFSMVVPVPCQAVVQHIKAHDLHFTSVFVYLLTLAAHRIPELRWRIRGDRVVEHDVVHPSFTVTTKDSDVFSFCYVEFVDNFKVFHGRVKKAVPEMRDSPSLEDEPGRDDYLFMSAMPWVHFTGLTHPMNIGREDSVPRIVWGKAEMKEGILTVPIGLQVHHALVDGRHASAFFTELESLFAAPESVLF